MERYAKINAYHVLVSTYLLEKLRSTPDVDGNLLDNSVVLYGSPMGNSNAHDHIDLPVFLAGNGAGKYRGSRHMRTPKGTPLANLFVTMAQKEGIAIESFGDSTQAMSI
jgi:hypothetical protein